MASEPPGPYGIGSDTWPGLATLAADAAQVVQAVSAIIASGDQAGPDAAGLRDSLQDQLGELRAAIDYVISKNALDWTAVNRQRDRKRSRYERAHRPTPPDQPAQEHARHTPSDQPAGIVSPGPRAPAAAGTGRPAPREQDVAHNRPATRHRARLSRSAPARCGRRPARAGAGAPSSSSSSD